jgi:hypothetical protein
LVHADEIVGMHAIANPTMRFAWNAIATGIRRRNAAAMERPTIIVITTVSR